MKLKILISLLASFGFIGTAHAQSGIMMAGSIAGTMVGGKVGNLATMGAMMPMCLDKKNPSHPMFCLMAAQSGAQAAKDSGTAKDARSAAQSLSTGSDWGSTDLGNGLTGSGLDKMINEYDKTLASNLDKLKTAAPNIDTAKGTVTTGKGTFSTAALNSGAAMADAGVISADQIAAADALIKKNDAFKMPVLNASAGGGGGSSSSSKSAKYDMPEFKFPTDEKENPRAPATAGLVKLANGEPIGTASDNIFNMLHTRYQKKVAEKIFVGQEQSR